MSEAGAKEVMYAVGRSSSGLGPGARRRQSVSGQVRAGRAAHVVSEVVERRVSDARRTEREPLQTRQPEDGCDAAVGDGGVAREVEGREGRAAREVRAQRVVGNLRWGRRAGRHGGGAGRAVSTIACGGGRSQRRRRRPFACRE
eukprot:6445563-Prymnesium_polylepis.1